MPQWGNAVTDALAQLYVRQLLMLRFNPRPRDAFQKLLGRANANANSNPEGHVVLLLDAVGIVSETIGPADINFQEVLCYAQTSLLDVIRKQKMDLHDEAYSLVYGQGDDDDD